MKNILLITGVLLSATLAAQDFNKELEGKIVPAKMSFGSGGPKDILMRYQAPEFFKYPNYKFEISLGSESELYNHTGGIDAFVVDGNIWGLRPNPTVKPANTYEFVVLLNQGAIERYSYIKYERKPGTEKENFVIIGSRTGTITRYARTNEMIEGVVSDAKIREWISDSPEVMEDLKKAETQANAERERQGNTAGLNKPDEPKKKGLMGALEKAADKDAEQKQAAAVNVDMNRIINNYNAWYDQQNPEKIRYQFSSPASWMALPKPAKTHSEIVAENEARKDALFAGRTATPSPEVASAKDNMPVKKETFAAKMDRIKVDGNKIGVILYLKPVMVPKPSANASGGSMMMNEAMPSNSVPIEGEYMDESLQVLGENFTAELNAALGITDIELIDINKMPYRDTKFGRLDDWWASKYKVVFAYSVDPRLRASHEEIDGKQKFSASLNMVNSLVVTEYIGGPGATKQDFLAQIINMGSFVTPSYTQDDDMTDVQRIYEKILDKLETTLVEKMKSERVDAMNKLVEKKLK